MESIYMLLLEHSYEFLTFYRRLGNEHIVFPKGIRNELKDPEEIISIMSNFIDTFISALF